MGRLRKMVANYKENDRRKREAEIRAEFKVVDKDGFLYLTHNGVALMRFSDDTSVSEVTGHLEGFRGVAMEYHGIK